VKLSCLCSHGAFPATQLTRRAAPNYCAVQLKPASESRWRPYPAHVHPEQTWASGHIWLGAHW
jgi:hypothetical protein